MTQEEANEKILEIMNKEDDLSQKEFQLFKELIFQCDLKIQNKYFTPLTYAVINNKNLNLSEEQWDYLIKNSDLKIQDQYGDSPLMYALFYNKEQNLNLNKDQFEYLIKNSNLKIQSKYGYTPLMYVFKYNKSLNLNLDQEQMNYLIQHSNLKQQNNTGYTHLMLGLINNKEQNLNLNQEQMNYLIQHSNLKQQNNNRHNAFLYAFIYNKIGNLNLSKEQLKKLYNGLKQEQEQEQEIFIMIIENNIKNEEINFLLYELQFKPNEKTIHWLKENKHQDIIQMIEKRDVLLQLNQDFKEIDNHQKIATIKI